MIYNQLDKNYSIIFELQGKTQLTVLDSSDEISHKPVIEFILMQDKHLDFIIVLF